MDLQPTFLDRLQHHALLLQQLDSLQDIQLNQLKVRLISRQRVQQIQVLGPELAQGQQPRVQDSQLFVTQGRGDTTAAGVTTEDYMVDAQVTDRVLDHGRGAEVAGVQDVGDVPVDKDIARLKTKKSGFGASGIGAADPEDLGLLAVRERWEQ